MAHFKARGGRAICVGIVGVNQADHCTSYEGGRNYTTDGRKYKHPVQEAAEAEARLRQYAAPEFDEFLILPFRATNEATFKFEWVSEKATALDYGAVLARVSQQYEARF